ncbi:MAG: anti-sigma factor antagonist [Verrucomicrobia bacterium]|nr:anti-sigma factor antagonist [Verrucomicrobiota bacterium]
MLRISEVHPPNHSVTLRLEGNISGPWVAEARHACERVLQAGQVLKLDLAQVEYLDANGAVLLSSLRSRGVVFVACSLFVETQLKTLPSANPTSSAV